MKFNKDNTGLEPEAITTLNAILAGIKRDSAANGTNYTTPIKLSVLDRFLSKKDDDAYSELPNTLIILEEEEWVELDREEDQIALGTMALDTIQEAEERKTTKKTNKPKEVQVKLLAFTGMEIGVFTAKVTAYGYSLINRKGKEMRFNNDGKQLDSSNPRYSNRIVVL